MESFKKIPSFIKAIKNNNIEAIKTSLSDFCIIYSINDRQELIEAIQYAINNSDFNYEQHQAITLLLDEMDTEKKLYIYEITNLKKNFSKQRLDKVLTLKQKLTDEGVIDNKKEDYPEVIDTNEKETDSSKKYQKYILIGTAILVGAYLIKKCTS